MGAGSLLFKTSIVFIGFVSVFIYTQPPFTVSESQDDRIFLTDKRFSPVENEVDLVSLTIEGKLPEYLIGGAYLRVGPNVGKIHLDQPYHWFDGDGFIFRLFFNSSSTASLRSRWLSTWYLVNATRRDGKMTNVLGTLRHPWKTLAFLLRQVSRNPRVTAANTALLEWRNRFFALYEGALPFEFNPMTLESIGPFSFGGQLTTSFTAHPRIDPETQELIFFGYIPPITGKLHYYVANSTSSLSVKGSVAFDHPKYLPRSVHDFAITKRRSLWLDFPLYMSPLHPLQGKEFILFHPEGNSYMGWHDRHSPESVQWVPIKPGYAFHFAAAWDENDDESVVVGCRSRHVAGGLWESDPPHNNRNGTLNDISTPYLYRWRLNRSSRNVSEGPLLDSQGKGIACEFPSSHPDKTGTKVRYIYASHFQKNENGKADVGSMAGIVKYDLELEKETLFSFGGHHLHGGEPFFFPNPSQKQEDDGSLLVFVYDDQKETSKVLVIDALTMKQVTSIPLNTRVPMGFHTLFVPKSSL